MHNQSPPIYHRDLKAENVLIMHKAEWKTKLCDFGISQIGDQSSFLASAQAAGTIPYMSP
jgi:serine/threonine protein kinase